MEDPPAKLFRSLLRAMKMNPSKWTRLLGEYLDWTIRDGDEESRKSRRLTKYGNIRDTFFNKTRLSANMLWEGMSIAQIKKCDIIMRCEDEDGNVYEIDLETVIRNARNSSSYVPTDNPEKDE